MKILRTTMLLSTLILAGCNPPPPLEKISLTPAYYTNGALVDFQLAKEFNDLVDADDSFAVYVYLPTCAGCNLFKPHIEAFTTNNNIQIFTLNGSIVDYTSLKDVVKYVPSVVLFEAGEVKYHLDPTENEKKALESEKAFESWFFDRVERLEI